MTVIQLVSNTCTIHLHRLRLKRVRSHSLHKISLQCRAEEATKTSYRCKISKRLRTLEESQENRSEIRLEYYVSMEGSSS